MQSVGNKLPVRGKKCFAKLFSFYTKFGTALSVRLFFFCLIQFLKTYFVICKISGKCFSSNVVKHDHIYLGKREIKCLQKHIF